MSSAMAASPMAASGLYSDDNEAALARVIAQCAAHGQRQIRHPDRPFRPQGLGAEAVGGRRRAQAGGRSVADHRGFADPVRRGLAHAARSRPKPTWSACATPSSPPRSARCASASTRSSCTWRTAIWRTASCRRSPTSAPTNMAARSRTACAFRSRSRARCVRWCRKACRSARVSPAATGARAA